MSKQITDLRITSDTVSIEIFALNFAQYRSAIMTIMVEMRQGKLSAAEGQAQIAALKEARDSIQTEINIYKMALATEGKANAFAKAVEMGKGKLIG